MAVNLIQDRSPSELKKEITGIVEKDLRALPGTAKIFAAVARLQEFDRLPEIADPARIDHFIAEGCKELQRGISPSDGVPAELYARELIGGTLHPGTRIAYGQGIYLSTPSIAGNLPEFPKISEVARHYACSPDGAGIVLRSILKNEVQLLEREDIFQHFREEKNRARQAGISDLGTFAAACGFRGYTCDGIAPKYEEEVVVVLDRTALVFQRVALQIPQKAR
jgi:hypothetical protein